MKPIGKHVLVDMYGCSFDVLNSQDFIKNALSTAISDAGMTLLQYSDYRSEPQRITVAAILAEGHLSLHTYPELGYVALDVFLFGDPTRPEKAIYSLRRTLKPNKSKTTHIRRGDFGSVSDMKPKVKSTATPMRRVRDTSKKVIRFFSRAK